MGEESCWTEHDREFLKIKFKKFLTKSKKAYGERKRREGSKCVEEQREREREIEAETKKE